MSGGHFDYNQWQISQIAEEIESCLHKQGQLKSNDELWGSKDYYEEYPEEKYYYTYPEEVQKRMREGVYFLKKAYIYAQRIDWYLSGDDGEDSLVSRLKSDLDELSQSCT